MTGKKGTGRASRSEDHHDPHTHPRRHRRTGLFRQRPSPRRVPRRSRRRRPWTWKRGLDAAFEDGDELFETLVLAECPAQAARDYCDESERTVPRRNYGEADHDPRTQRPRRRRGARRSAAPVPRFGAPTASRRRCGAELKERGGALHRRCTRDGREDARRLRRARGTGRRDRRAEAASRPPPASRSRAGRGGRKRRAGGPLRDHPCREERPLRAADRERLRNERSRPNMPRTRHRAHGHPERGRRLPERRRLQQGPQRDHAQPRRHPAQLARARRQGSSRLRSPRPHHRHRPTRQTEAKATAPPPGASRSRGQVEEDGNGVLAARFATTLLGRTSATRC